MIPMWLCHTSEKSGRNVAELPEQKLPLKNLCHIGLDDCFFFVVVVVCSELLVGLNICMDHSLTVYIFLSVLSFHVNEKRFPFCRVLLILSIQNKQIFMLY